MNAKRTALHILLLLVLIVAPALVPPVTALAQDATASAPMPAALYAAVLDSSARRVPALQASNGSYQIKLQGMHAALGSGGLALASQKGSAWNWNLQVNGFGR